MSPACYSEPIHTCQVCGLRTYRPHGSHGDCILALRARLEDREPVFGLHNRRFRFLNHPDADAGQYVVAAGFGEGETMWTKAHHELVLCLDEDARQKLIALLQGEPEGTS